MRGYLTPLATALLVMLLLLCVSASAPPSASASGPALFVAPTGNDANDCLSPGNPCKTVQAAVGKAQPGSTISVTAGLYSEHLTIDKTLSVTGADPDLTILDGGRTDRVVSVSKGASVYLSNLTIRHGHTAEQGGGIKNDGTVIIMNCRITFNDAASGGGIVNNGRLIVADSEISANWANTFGGGGILNYGVATIKSSLIAKNACPFYGAGIANYQTLEVFASTIDANSSPSTGMGAGILSMGAFTPTLTTLSNVLIDGNTAPTGAGIANIQAALTITNSTLAANSGGGIYLSGNGPVTYHNAILADNTPQNCLYEGESSAVSADYNLDSGQSCGLSPDQHNFQNTDPLLGAWQPTRGRMWTRPLLAGSPAIDNGSNDGCAPTDMRDVYRPVDGNNDGVRVCDIGAYEYVPPRAYLPLVALNAQPANVEPPGTLTADNSTLHPGECTVLRWTTRGAQKVYLDGQMVADRGTRQVCPAQTTTCTLRVISDGPPQPINFTTTCTLTVAAGSETDQQKAIRLATVVMRQAIGTAAVERARVEAFPKPNGWALIFRDAYASCAEGSFWPGACVGAFPTPEAPRVFRDVYACVNDITWLVGGEGASITAPLDPAPLCLDMRAPGAPTQPPLPTYPPASRENMRVTP